MNSENMRKRKDYLKCVVVLMSLLLATIIVFGLIVVAEEERGPPEQMNIGPELEPAPQEIIDEVDNYIISIVGGDYFAEHFKFNKSITTGTDYKLTYVYTHDLKDELGNEPYQVEHLFVLRVDSEGNLTGKRISYTGPREPYQFLISKSEAREIAKQNGLEEPQLELYYGNQGYNSDTPIEEGTYVWLAWVDGCFPKGTIEGLFIHVDTGEILGRMVSSGCGGTVTGEYVEGSTDIEKTDIGSMREIQITSINETDNTPDTDENVVSSDKEETSIFQKIINWIKHLFAKEDNTK